MESLDEQGVCTLLIAVLLRGLGSLGICRHLNVTGEEPRGSLFNGSRIDIRSTATTTAMMGVLHTARQLNGRRYAINPKSPRLRQGLDTECHRFVQPTKLQHAPRQRRRTDDPCVHPSRSALLLMEIEPLPIELGRPVELTEMFTGARQPMDCFHVFCY
ncbi:hypothetical protein GCM10010341_33200 [Streptomyces noursei]|nr:hypothetical protein GCM10010341_33200 [Streptomyces noursei]